MNRTFTSYRIQNRMAALTLLLSLLTFYAQAQISLVKWQDFFSGPPITPFSALSMNSTKVLDGYGQSAPAGIPLLFVTSAGAPTDPVFSSNGWNNGAGVACFRFNFATNNYSSINVKFILGILGSFGPRNFQTQYSTSSATGPWNDVGGAMALTGTIPPTGLSTNPTITLPAACSNVSNVWVRIITTDNSLPSSYTGGPYIDNVEVTGSGMSAPTIATQPGNSTVCEGADATFTVVANNAVSYQWQYRTSSSGAFSNVPSNATFDNETTAALTVNNVTTAMSGYQFQCVVTGGTTPNAISNTVTLTVNAYGTWNGSANTNWNNASNWNCGQVPTASTNVTINSGGNQPVVNVGDAVCNNLTINSGATLTFAAGSNQLDIKGTVAGGGTLNGTAGKVIFSGAGAQSIPAGSYKDLQMNGAGSKTLAGNISVAGVLSLTSGTITLGSNNLTITGTGSTTGANASSFVVTNGTGLLINQGIGSGGKTGNINFPVGASAASYTPLVLNNNAGVVDNFSVMVKDGVYTNYSGTTGTGALSTNAVNKTWFVTEGTPGGSNVNLQLTWNGNNQLSGFDPNNCYLSHYTGSAWNAGPLTFAVGADPFIVSRTGITSFSPFGVGSIGSPLPLDLLDFYGKKTPDGALLQWTTANEQSIRSYSIERSADGNKYETAGTVAARGSKEQTVYSYTDPKLITPVAFYRLRMNHEGGDATYSKVIQLHTAGSNVVSIYPNPVEDNTVYIRVDQTVSSDVTISITDLSGKLLYTKQLAAAAINKGICPLSVQTLAVGQYILQLHTSEGALIGQTKLIRQ